MGKIEGSWIGEERKVDILLAISEAKEKGMTCSRACHLWMIERRRVIRWNGKWKRGESLVNGRPGPREPIHRLLPQERQTVLSVAVRDEYADLSHRILAVTAWDRGLFLMSFSSVYRILRSENLMSMRGYHRYHNGQSRAPERKELTGPNQRWCWDISYLKTFEKGLFLFLYLLLDEYSRKVIHFLISWNQRAEEARELIETGLMKENILALPEGKRPEIINDHGRQMKASSIQRVFRDHGMPQLFARPRTPNDNPFVESLFGAAKTAPGYPDRFLDREDASRYFDSYFRWYNSEHLHSGIDYVTPDQCHRGLKDILVKERKAKLQEQRRLRKETNRRLMDLGQSVSDWFTTSLTIRRVA